MQLSFGSTQGLSLSGLVVLSLSASQIAIAAPVSQHDNLSKRDTRYISLQEAKDYLTEYYPETGKYLLYSGASYNQLENFQGLNDGYYGYNDFFLSTTSEHFDEAFDIPAMDVDVDAETGSRAIAEVATGVYVFGAVKYQDFPNSFYTGYEAPYLKNGVNEGRLEAINHMQMGATTPDQVLATEDGSGRISYLNGQSGDNSSGASGDCSQTQQAPTCDAPPG